MKKIISISIFALSVLCISACNNNISNNPNNPPVTNSFSEPEPIVHEPMEVPILHIENTDVFEKGYYEYFFDYEGEEDFFYQLSTKAVFERMWDVDTDWKVYVSDRKIREEYIDYMFENTEPDLVNDGELDIHSGQWIYFYCDHNSSNSDKPNNAGYTVKYPFGELPDKTEMTPESEVENFFSNVYEFGEPLLDYTVCDVTGDGYDDYCNCHMTGSGMVRVQLIVYDQKNHLDYVLDGYDYSYKIIGVENEKLIVEEIGPYGYDDSLIKTTTGTVMIDEDDNLVFIKELSEKDLMDFGDFSGEWIDEKIKEISITSAEEIEYVRWVDDTENALQIGIKYKMPSEDRWCDHKKDYFVFKDDCKPLLVDYSFEEKTGTDRMVFANPTFESHFEDVNFDGSDELIIHRGTNGNSGMEMYSAYELKDGEYVFFPAFEWIYSYTVNWDDKTIECVRTSGDSENKTYITTYSYEDGKYYKTGERESE